MKNEISTGQRDDATRERGYRCLERKQEGSGVAGAREISYETLLNPLSHSRLCRSILCFHCGGIVSGMVCVFGWMFY